jgi:hypothetical protein
MSLAIKNLDAPLGAEIFGLDLSKPIAPNEVKTIGSENIDTTPFSLLFGAFPLELGGVMARKVKRREWTGADVRDLKSFAKKKMPVKKIAKSLKRTLAATKNKASSLGVSLYSRR